MQQRQLNEQKIVFLSKTALEKAFQSKNFHTISTERKKIQEIHVQNKAGSLILTRPQDRKSPVYIFHRANFI